VYFLYLHQDGRTERTDGRNGRSSRRVGEGRKFSKNFLYWFVCLFVCLSIYLFNDASPRAAKPMKTEEWPAEGRKLNFSSGYGKGHFVSRVMTQNRTVQHTDIYMTQRLAESIFKTRLVGSRYLRHFSVFYPTRRRRNKLTSFVDISRKDVNCSGCLPCGKEGQNGWCTSTCIMLRRTQATSFLYPTCLSNAVF
jgi:hypothetical protein